MINILDTTTEVRCDFWDLIKYSCAHCLGHELDHDVPWDSDES